MAKLTAKARSKIPAKDFAGPGRSFPINDRNHQKAAISMASRSEKAGNITSAEKAKIVAKAKAKLGKGKSALDAFG